MEEGGEIAERQGGAPFSGSREVEKPEVEVLMLVSFSASWSERLGVGTAVVSPEVVEREQCSKMLMRGSWRIWWSSFSNQVSVSAPYHVSNCLYLLLGSWCGVYLGI